MGSHVLQDAVILYDGYNFSTQLNEVRLEYGARMLPEQVFGDDTEINKAGPMIVSANVVGLWDADAVNYNPDKKLFDDLGQKDKLFSVFPLAAAEGKIGFSFLSSRSVYTPSGEWGELFRFNAAGDGRSRLLRPTVLSNTTQTGTGNGTSRQVGAVSATQKLYAILHVLASSGTSQTLDVTIESDDASGFSSPTTRITFSQVTTQVGAQFATPIVGAITDDWWRASWTIGGTSPSFTFLVGISILDNYGG